MDGVITGSGDGTDVGNEVGSGEGSGEGRIETLGTSVGVGDGSGVGHTEYRTTFPDMTSREVWLTETLAPRILSFDWT